MRRYNNKYKIVKDPEYGYLRVDPIPTQKEVEKFYLEEFYSSTYKQFNDSSLRVQKAQREFYDSRWEAIYNNCLRYFGKLKGRSVFDIGCGFARALLYFKRKGMKTSGLEPSLEGTRYARSQGLDVFHSGIEDLGCAGKGRFDIVMLLNVLEHLRHPAETLSNIKKTLLKRRGLLVIDVPNDFNDFQIVANKEFKLNEWWVCPPAHINYFSVSSLKRLLVKCGYNIIHSESSFPLEIFMLMGDVYVGNQRLGAICHQRRVRFEQMMRKYDKQDKLSQFYKVLAKLDIGRQVVVYAAPK